VLLDAERIERILAPFRRPSAGLSVSLEDATGQTVVVASDAGLPGGARLTRDLRADGAPVGRLVAEGPAVTERSVAAALEALAIGLEALAEAGRRPSVVTGDDAAAPDPRSGIAAELALSRMQQRSIVSLLARWAATSSSCSRSGAAGSRSAWSSPTSPARASRPPCSWRSYGRSSTPR
jgi:hypothetical protein